MPDSQPLSSDSLLGGYPTDKPTTPPLQVAVVAVALLCLIVGTVHLARTYPVRHSTLLLIGAALGLILYHARLGFTTAFRVFVVTGDGRGIRAQMLMLALASMLFAPLLALNPSLDGAVAPLSLSVLIGAMLFGVGMQLGGG